MSATVPQQPDLAAIKQRQQKMWATGDYLKVGSRTVVMSEMLCAAVDPRAGQRVLDVASGTGNAALAAARRFCDVVSTDYVPDLLEHGRARAEAEGLAVRFDVADAENLPYPDSSFDVVLSAIGAMFAPDQQRTAREMLRVCRPGGKIGMANWVPGGFVGAMFQTSARYNPPPPGVKPPMVWGTEEGLNELLGNDSSLTHIQRRSIRLTFLSPDHVADFYISNFGPAKTAHDALDPDRQSLFREDLRQISTDLNASGDETIALDSDYLEIVAVRH